MDSNRRTLRLGLIACLGIIRVRPVSYTYLRHLASAAEQSPELVDCVAPESVLSLNDKTADLAGGGLFKHFIKSFTDLARKSAVGFESDGSQGERAQDDINMCL